VIGGGSVIHKALARFKAEGRGVLIYLRDGTAGVPVVKPGTAGESTEAQRAEQESTEAQRAEQWREIGLGAQILRDLGISSIRLLASRTRNYVGLSGFGIEIVSTESLDG